MIVLMPILVKRFLVTVAFLATVPVFSQVVVKGQVMDDISGELLANALVTTRNQSAITTKDGAFVLQLPMGEYKIVCSLDGYSSDSLILQADRNLITGVVFKLNNQSASMQAIQITASVAKDRKTPIAYSNLMGKDLQERLGSADLPTMLNQIPGVYSTQQGGGAGDARINIRGFNQRNIAVMIDGIPVNDMENGWVYWSNWFGLGGVTSMTQVQRGLGSSRIANPAVGGSMNIITRGIGNQERIEGSVEIGDSRYEQYSFNYTSGKLPGDWGFTMSGTRRTSSGYVDYLYDNMFAYFFKLEKQFGKKHTLSFAGMGAPQSHGQRSFRARLSLYDDNLARELGMDTTLPRMSKNMGRKYNQHWGTIQEFDTLQRRDLQSGTVTSVDTVWGRGYVQNERENMFHKPQFYIKHDWKKSSKLFITSSIYASYGRGGGTQAASGKIPQIPQNYGNYNFQSAYENNKYGDGFFYDPIDPKYSETERKSAAIIQRGVNNHNWYGLLSTAQYKLNSYWNLTGGVDARMYYGKHWREVYNLLGGDYFIPADINPNYASNHMYRKGDKFFYHNDGLVNWYGAFGEAEYSKGRTSAFFNASASRSNYKRIDYFKLDSNKNPQHTDWVRLNGLTLKSGLNHNISRKINLFSNVGYLNRPARFSNIFDNSNKRVRGVENELVYALEGGTGYKSKRVAITLNGYYTLWKNKPVDFLSRFTDLDGNEYTFNINGLSALHKGIELQYTLKPGDGISIEGGVAMGDWVWQSGSKAIVRNDAGDSIGAVNFNANGVHVGDAAQNQVTVLLRYEPTYLKGAYFTWQYIRFGKHFADFDPTVLVGSYAGKESFRLPDYWVMNLSAGYKFSFKNGTRVQIYGMVNNVTDNLYISDAQHRSPSYNLNVSSVEAETNARNTFNPKNLEVFVAPGLRYTTGIRITL
jgi:iron complex outermembrane receptor protein